MGRKRKINYNRIDRLLQDESLSYTAIAEKVGHSITAVWRRAQLLRDIGELPQRRRGPRRTVEGIQLLEDIIENPNHSFRSLAKKYDINPGLIKDILEEENITVEDMKIHREKYKEEFPRAQYALLATLTQHYFNRLIEERGLDYALAWRVRDKLRWGKKYSLETLEMLIAARREGNSFSGSAKLAGLEKTFGIPHIKRILDKALHDVDYNRPNSESGKKKYLRTQKERDAFCQMWDDKHTLEEISEVLEIPVPSINYWRKKLGLQRRTISPDKERALEMIRQGATYRQVSQETGCSETSYYRWKRKLN